jgi:hypothetical protein
VLLLQSHLVIIPNGGAEEKAALFSRCFLREAARCVFLNLVGKAVAAARFVEFVLRAPHRLGVTYSSVRAWKVCTRVNRPTSALSSGGKNDGDLRKADMGQLEDGGWIRVSPSTLSDGVNRSADRRAWGYSPTDEPQRFRFRHSRRTN